MRVNIKKMRKSFGLTQAEFAEKLGCYQTNVSFLEKGLRNTTPEMYTKLCAAFGKAKVDNFIEPDVEPVRNTEKEESQTERLTRIVAEQQKQIAQLLELNMKLVEMLGTSSVVTQ